MIENLGSVVTYTRNNTDIDTDYEYTRINTDIDTD